MSNDRMQVDDFNELLRCATEQTSKETEKIEIEKLKHFPNHKFKLYTGERFENMVESVKEYGVLLPIIAWENNYEYIILSGHNRVEACKKAGIDEIPCIIKDNLTLEEATLIV
ncbi:MAG: ParB N-terminal domain-containing protein, partial [Eubacteriales bacterium]|nr:ParB N-terminal domain-containing protein [Eubacteriales bacterium]